MSISDTSKNISKIITDMVSTRADINLSNLTSKGNERLLNGSEPHIFEAQKGFKTENVLDDPFGYQELYENKYSLFKKDDFSIIGTPVDGSEETLTDDGVVTIKSPDVSGAERFTIGQPDYSNAGSVRFESPVYYLDDNTIPRFLVEYIPNNPGGLNPTFSHSASVSSGVLKCSSRIVNTDGSVVNNVLTTSVSTSSLRNNKFQLALNYSGNNIDWFLKREGGTWEVLGSTEVGPVEAPYIGSTRSYFVLGGDAYGTAKCIGMQMDLRYTRLYIDGNLVISGSPHNIDIIKTDNYEIVGSPIITKDGTIYYPPLSGNYVTYTNIPLNYKDFKATFDFYIKELPDTTKYLIRFLKGDYGLACYTGHGKNTEWFFQKINTGDVYLGSGPVIYGGLNKVSLEINSDVVVSTINGIELRKNFSNIDMERVGPEGDYQLYVLPWSGDMNSANIQLDLNSIKIYVDGKLVYQPCLKIPYIEGKTGSKIVPAHARNRVEDLYEQTGEALYWTIDEENKNYTLPKGEVYGMIDNSRKSNLPVGMIFTHTCSASYIPENSLPCDGAKYTRDQFPRFYDEWLVGNKLNTCTFDEFETEVSTTGECWKFGLDTTTQSFKVPKINDIIVRGISDTTPVVGNDKTIGLTDGTTVYPTGTTTANNIFGYVMTRGDYDTYSQVGVSRPATSSPYPAATTTLGLSTDPTKSGIIADTSDVLITQTTKYFVVVATGSINQSEMDWSAWASGLNGKLNADHSNDTKPYIKTTMDDGNGNGYIIYSNGYAVQYGVILNTYTGSSDGALNVTFYKEFTDTNYFFTRSPRWQTLSTVPSSDEYTAGDFNRTTTGTSVGTHSNVYVAFICWEAKGYLKEGEY